MKIIRVIVDWLPVACFDCDFEGAEMCILVGGLLGRTRYEKRPDWCPLVEEKGSWWTKAMAAGTESEE